MELRNQAITTPPLVRPHGIPPRGMDMDTRSVLFEGRFGRLFGALPPADFGADDRESERLLEKLAAAMMHTPDCPKDLQDDEESGIPAAYTYLGQFIDHDITFDPSSSLMRQNDPDALVDFRTPRLDLDSIYGRGPDDEPFLYAPNKTLLQGTEIHGQALGNDILHRHDLPRAANDRAIIGDPRNDENAIVSQLQGLFLAFHNRYLTDHPDLTFEEVQRDVRFHYQWVVTTDFLRRIVSKRVLHAVLPHLADDDSNVIARPPHMRFYRPRNSAFMPFEFAVAAYRLGHSMVRPGYRLNDAISPLPIFALTAPPAECVAITETLRGFRAMNPQWAIDWSRFLDIEPRAAGSLDANDATNQERTQLAYKIDPSIVDPLANLPESVTGPNPGVFKSLAARNLVRGWRMRLPSGQAITRVMGVVPLKDAEILIGSAADDATTLPSIEKHFPKFIGKCPLWTYILAEAAHNFRVHPEKESVETKKGRREIDTPKLGDVGGTIVAETFAGMMLDDRHSFWRMDPLWRPTLVPDGDTFDLRTFINYAIG